jgi:hypothetical protein
MQGQVGAGMRQQCSQVFLRNVDAVCGGGVAAWGPYAQPVFALRIHAHNPIHCEIQLTWILTLCQHAHCAWLCCGSRMTGSTAERFMYLKGARYALVRYGIHLVGFV